MGSVMLSGGAATLNINGLTAGSHSFACTYAGDTKFYGSTSNTTSGNVGQASTSVSLGTSGTPSNYGSAVTFTASVSPSAATGTIQFKDGASNLGSPVTLSGDSAVYTTSTLTVGSHTITAVYNGDTNYAGSTSAGTTQTVNKATPTITWAAPAAISYGSALSGAQLNASFSVPGSCVYSPAAGTVLAAGPQTLSVTCTPTDTSDYNSASSSVSLTVNKAVLTVTANNASRAYGAGNPTFSASYSGFVNGNTQASATTGAPSLSTTATSSAAGTYPITAAQGTLAATNYSFSFAPGTLTVNQAVLTVTANSLSKTYGTANPSLTYAITGFQNGDIQASATTGAPSLSTTATTSSAAGTYPITAATGTLAATNYSFVFTNGTLTVSRVAAAVAVTSSVNPSVYHQTVTFTFNLSGAGVTPTGSVAVTVGGTNIGSLPLNAAGQTTYTTEALPVGSQNVVATIRRY